LFVRWGGIPTSRSFNTQQCFAACRQPFAPARRPAPAGWEKPARHRVTVRHTLDSMSKSKIPETGEGYLGEIMVHRISRAVGVVENVTEARAGWPPEITLKLPDGTFKKGHLSDFREPSAAERKKISPA
jgi:hypothetical protein